MRRPVYLDSARDDFVEIFRFISRESGSAAVGRRFVGELRAQCRKLASLPYTLGTSRPDLHPDIRSVAHKGYIILFCYRGAEFVVVDVVEGHRDIESMMLMPPG